MTIRQFARVLLLSAFALLAACNGQSSSSSASSGTGTTVAGDGTVSFMHYNDLHAHLTPHLDRVRDASGATSLVERGGLARIATLVKQIRADNPNSILMNIGDTFHGGVEATFTLGNAVVAPMNALGVDVGVPGNWDFAYGPSVTRLRFTGNVPAAPVFRIAAPTISIAQPSYPNLAANITLADPDPNAGQPFLPATLMLERGGVRVGMIGISSDIVPLMFEGLAAGLSFLSGETAYRDLINQQAAALRAQGAEIVVVMSELGLQKDFRLAGLIDPGSVDVIFSAHTHEVTKEPLNSASGALVVEAGNDGYLGRMDITVAGGKVTARNWQLLSVDASIAEDPAMKALVDTARAPFLVSDPAMTIPLNFSVQELHQPIDTVVGHTDIALDRRNALESTFNDAYTDELRGVLGTAVAITPGFRFDSVMPAAGTLLEDNTVTNGEITLEDVYRFFPVEFQVATAETTGANLKSILEGTLTSVFSTDVFRQAGGWMPGFSGLDVGIDLTAADGARVSSLVRTDTGMPVADSDLLSVAGCIRPRDDVNGILCSYPGFTNVVAVTNAATGGPLTAVDMFTAYLSGNRVTQTHNTFTDVSAYPQWPQSPYVQPLRGATTPP